MVDAKTKYWAEVAAGLWDLDCRLVRWRTTRKLLLVTVRHPGPIDGQLVSTILKTDSDWVQFFSGRQLVTYVLGPLLAGEDVSWP